MKEIEKESLGLENMTLQEIAELGKESFQNESSRKEILSKGIKSQELGIVEKMDLDVRAASCDLNLPAVEHSIGMDVPKKPLTFEEAIRRDDVIVKDKAGKVITKELFQKMKDHAAMLRKKFPHMKMARIQRKVQDHFKIKL